MQKNRSAAKHIFHSSHSPLFNSLTPPHLSPRQNALQALYGCVQGTIIEKYPFCYPKATNCLIWGILRNSLTSTIGDKK